MAQVTGVQSALKTENAAISENFIKQVWVSDNDKTPFISAVGVQKAPLGDRTVEWFNDTYGTPNGNVGQVVASDITSVKPAPVVKVANCMQIFGNAFAIDNAVQKTAPAGGAGTYEYTLGHTLKLQKLNIEQRALSGKGSKKPTTSQAGMLAGVGSIIRDNANHGTGGSTPAFTNGLYGDVTLATAGNRRVITEVLFKDVLKDINKAAGNSNSLCAFSNPDNTDHISGFKGRASTVETDAKENTADAYIDAYKSPYGDRITLVTSQECPLDAVYIVDKSETYLAAWRQFEETTDRGSTTSDGTNYAVRTEITLVLGNQKSHGKIADLKAS